MDKNKKRILIDLDGVLNNYSGEYQTDFIPEIKAGANEFIEELNKNYELYLFTSRNLLLSAKWLFDNKIDKYFADITNTKLPAHIYIDDRTINFKGDFKIALNEIKNFKVYWKNKVN
jgi:hypothetical protein